MRVKIDFLGCHIFFGRHNQLRHATGSAVEMRFVKYAVFHLRRDQPVIYPAAARHLQFQSGGNAPRAVIHRAPIRDHQPFEAPAVAQNIAQ